MWKRALHLLRGEQRRSGFRAVAARTSRTLRFELLEDRRVLATFTVTTLSDAAVLGPGNAPGTLRQAVFDANALAGDDTITFANNLSGAINLSVVGNNALSSSALLVTSAITITGNSNGITISRDAGAPAMRLFYVTAVGNLTLDSVSLTAGEVHGANATSADQAGGLGLGGAIYSAGTLQIVSSTIYNNQAFGGNGGTAASAGTGRGGAIYNDRGNLTITNSTLSGNAVHRGAGATAPSFGGGVYSNNGVTSVRNSTLTNSAANAGRGLYIYANELAAVDVQSSIIGQSDVNLLVREFLTVLDGDGELVVTGSNNLIRSQSGFQSITVSTDDPLLEPLANNGGPTMTHALTDESPAINQGNNSQGLFWDQRGANNLRVRGTAADIGAYEFQTSAAPPLPEDYNHNNFVDAADYVVWRKTRGTNVTAYTSGDGTGDGAVDTADYDVWQAHFGETLPGTAGIVVLNDGSDTAPRIVRDRQVAAAIQSTSSTARNLNNLLLAISSGDIAGGVSSDNLWPSQAQLDDSDQPKNQGRAGCLVDGIFAKWPTKVERS